MVIPIKVSDVMKRDLITISPETTLMDCARILTKRKIGALILADEKKRIKGILTQTDIIWALTKKNIKDLKDVKAKDVASRKVKTVKPEMEIQQALKRMRKTRFKRLPVLYQGRVVGILTLNDILRLEPSFYQSLSDFIKLKEQTETIKKRELLAEGKKWDKEGLCEDCGNFSLISKIDGRMLCEGCADSM